jgi:glycosyltransferase involved in cell wall biosynthesis
MKVSVLVLTYNHEKFIAQALDSILMQEGNFDYEIVIGEDCSTDKTRDIVIDHQKKYPDKIRLLLPGKNLGMMRNLVQTYNACTGEYIAILEGDDYWTSPHKLQKQIAFLDTNFDFAICFHNARAVWEDGKLPSTLLCPLFQKRESTIEDLIAGNPVPTLSVMLRNRLVTNFPDWFFDLSYGDWPLLLLAAQYGKIGYLREPMAVYRIHAGGAASAAHTNEEKYLKNIYGIIQVYELFNSHFDFRYNKLIVKKISDFRRLADKCKNKGNISRLEPLLKWSEKFPALLHVHYGVSSTLRLIKLWATKIRAKI